MSDAGSLVDQLITQSLYGSGVLVQNVPKTVLNKLVDLHLDITITIFKLLKLYFSNVVYVSVCFGPPHTYSAVGHSCA